MVFLQGQCIGHTWFTRPRPHLMYPITDQWTRLGFSVPSLSGTLNCGSNIFGVWNGSKVYMSVIPS